MGFPDCRPAVTYGRRLEVAPWRFYCRFCGQVFSFWHRGQSPRIIPWHGAGESTIGRYGNVYQAVCPGFGSDIRQEDKAP